MLRSNLDGQGPHSARGDDFEFLRRFGVGRSFPARTRLFSPAEAPDCLYLIEAGVVELVEERPLGRGHVIQTVGRGVCVGDLPVMLQLPFTYSAVTRTDVTAQCLTLETVHALVEASPAVWLRFMRLVSNRLAQAEQRLSELGERSALEQVVHFLLNRTDEETGTLRTTQRDIAADLGLSRQTVSGVLRQLAHLQLVESRRGEVRIRDHEGLERIRNPAGPHQRYGDAPAQH